MRYATCPTSVTAFLGDSRIVRRGGKYANVDRVKNQEKGARKCREDPCQNLCRTSGSAIPMYGKPSMNWVTSVITQVHWMKRPGVW